MIGVAVTFGLLEVLPIDFGYVWFALLLLAMGLSPGAVQLPQPGGRRVGKEPPVGALFAAFLGLDPIKQLVPAAVLGHLPAAQRATLTGRAFFPHLISGPFGTGLRYAFDFAIGCSLVAAVASWLRGGRYVHGAFGPLGGGTGTGDGDGAGEPARAGTGAGAATGGPGRAGPPTGTNAGARAAAGVSR